MKKSNLFLCGALLLSVSFLSSCTKDTSSDSPVITFDNGLETATAVVGGYTVTGTITSVTGLSSIKFETVVGGNSTQMGAAITSFDNKNSYIIHQAVTGITETTQLRITAVDKNDVTTTKVFTITVPNV